MKVSVSNLVCRIRSVFQLKESVVEMESQVVRRRANVISAHLAAHEDISARATHLFPMACSTSLNSIFRRCHNRTNFARQGSDSQGYYMRPSSYEQGEAYAQPSLPIKSTSCGVSRPNALETPAFARPAQVEPPVPYVKGIPPVAQRFEYSHADPEAADPGAPMFARPRRNFVPPEDSEERTTNLESKGYEWSPRVDIVETGHVYIVTSELPGVGPDNIKVEVGDDKNLIISGNRPNWLGGEASSKDTDSSYQRREISHGPYRVIWPLPMNANKDNITAEIQDGLLRITIPKLTGLRWLKKVYM